MSAENSRQEVFKYAEENNLLVTFGSPTVLKLDIDAVQTSVAQVHQMIQLLKSNHEYPVTLVVRNPSKTPGNWHYSIFLGRAVEDRKTRYTLQAFLGSDRTREYLNYTNPGIESPHRDVDECFFVDRKTDKAEVLTNEDLKPVKPKQVDIANATETGEN